jgi:hypothetical protein
MLYKVYNRYRAGSVFLELIFIPLQYCKLILCHYLYALYENRLKAKLPDRSFNFY